jgi:hypothetical protein
MISSSIVLIWILILFLSGVFSKNKDAPKFWLVEKEKIFKTKRLIRNIGRIGTIPTSYDIYLIENERKPKRQKRR